MKIAGLDLGTTGCKCTVFDTQGNYLNKAYRSYPVKRQTGSHEIDISVIMASVFAVIKEMADQYPDIAGIGVTSFGETFVATDENGNPLYPAMLYTDPRGAEDCAALVEEIGSKEIAYKTGLRPHEMYSLPKMMWLKRNEPEIWSRMKHIFLLEDYVVYHLTGVAQIDYSLATRTMGFDINTLDWSKELFEAADIDPKIMSRPVPTGTVAGTVTARTAQKTGLLEDTKIVSVSHDQVSAAIGAGAFDGSVAVDGAGTVECLTAIYDTLPDMDAMYDGYFAVVPYVTPGKYVAYAFSYTGGALMQWCTETVAKQESELADKEGTSVHQYLEQQYVKKYGYKEPGNLLVLPHFAGAATPYMDTGSKGAILGLTTATTVDEIYRGCMEGVAYEMLLNYKAMKDSGVCFGKIHATGGGSHSAMWMQMKADMLNVPIVSLKTVDAGTVGSAMLTGIAIGVFDDLETAYRAMVVPDRTYTPDLEMHEKYEKIYQRYAQVYRAVRPLMEEKR